MQHTQSETEQHFSNILLPEFPRLQVQGLRIRGGVGADTNWARQEGGFCHWQMPRISRVELVEAWVTQRAGGTGRRCEDLRQKGKRGKREPVKSLKSTL